MKYLTLLYLNDTNNTIIEEIPWSTLPNLDELHYLITPAVHQAINSGKSPTILHMSTTEAVARFLTHRQAWSRCIDLKRAVLIVEPELVVPPPTTTPPVLSI